MALGSSGPGTVPERGAGRKGPWWRGRETGRASPPEPGSLHAGSWRPAEVLRPCLRVRTRHPANTQALGRPSLWAGQRRGLCPRGGGPEPAVSKSSRQAIAVGRSEKACGWLGLGEADGEGGRWGTGEGVVAALSTLQQHLHPGMRQMPETRAFGKNGVFRELVYKHTAGPSFHTPVCPFRLTAFLEEPAPSTFPDTQRSS